MSTKAIKVMLIALAALFLTSCEQFEEAQEIVLKTVGTSNLKLYERCLNQRSSSLSLNAQKRYCSNKYEQHLPIVFAFLTGAGHYDSDSLEWSGTLKNTSSSYIVSRVILVISEKKKGATVPFITYLCAEPIWIEPGEEKYLSCKLRLDQFGSHTYECPSDDNNDWCWKFSEAEGFDIND